MPFSSGDDPLQNVNLLPLEIIMSRSKAFLTNRICGQQRRRFAITKESPFNIMAFFMAEKNNNKIFRCLNVIVLLFVLEKEIEGTR